MQREPPARTTILRWESNFQETANLAHRGGNGRPAASQDTVEMVQQMFESEPRTSLRQAERALGVPHATIHRILRRKLAMFP